MGRIPRLRPVDICQRKSVDFKVQRCVAAKAGPLARVDLLEKKPASHCASAAKRLENRRRAPRAHKKARADRAGLVALIAHKPAGFSFNCQQKRPGRSYSSPTGPPDGVVSEEETTHRFSFVAAPASPRIGR